MESSGAFCYLYSTVLPFSLKDIYLTAKISCFIADDDLKIVWLCNMHCFCSFLHNNTWLRISSAVTSCNTKMLLTCYLINNNPNSVRGCSACMRSTFTQMQKLFFHEWCQWCIKSENNSSFSLFRSLSFPSWLCIDSSWSTIHISWAGNDRDCPWNKWAWIPWYFCRQEWPVRQTTLFYFFFTNKSFVFPLVCGTDSGSFQTLLRVG